MARLIDANESLRLMRNSKADNPCTDTIRKGVWNVAHDCAISCVDACPTVDAVEVVRCKDCKHWFKSDNGSRQMIGRTDGVCRMLMDIHYSERYMTESNHFCSYGERRTDG